MDCLDRTNVVQSALAKWVLNNQLREIGILSVKESVDEHYSFLNLFRNGETLSFLFFPLSSFSFLFARSLNTDGKRVGVVV